MPHPKPSRKQIKDLEEWAEEYETPPLIFDAQSLLLFIALMQLAMRHPSLSQHQYDTARSIADSIIKRIEETHPEIAKIMREGYQ